MERLRGFAWGELPLPIAPLIASLVWDSSQIKINSVHMPPEGCTLDSFS